METLYGIKMLTLKKGDGLGRKYPHNCGIFLLSTIRMKRKDDERDAYIRYNFGYRSIILSQLHFL